MKSRTIPNTIPVLTLLILASFASRMPASSPEERPASPAELRAAKRVLDQLEKAHTKSNFTALRDLMTDPAWDEFCLGKIQEAIMISSAEYGNNKATASVLEKYGIAAEQSDDAADATKLLDGLEDSKRRLKLLQELSSSRGEPGGMGPGDAMMQVIEISPFRGKIVGSTYEDERLNLTVEPELPPMLAAPGLQMLDLQLGDALPPGVDIQEFQVEGSPGTGSASVPNKDMEIEMGMMMGGLPSFRIDLVKVDGQWKCDGLRPEIDESLPTRSHPTIEDPNFAGTTPDGSLIRLEDHRGKLVLLDFWGTWCKGCIAEFPKLKKIHSVLAEENFVLLGIAQDSASNVAKYIGKNPLPWNSVIDGGKICRQFKVNVFPTTILIDEKGNHVASNLHGRKLAQELASRLDLNAGKTRELAKALGLSQRDTEKLLSSLTGL